VLVTALPTIAVQAGANRIVRGISITHPASDPTAADEAASRVALIERALVMLGTPIDRQTVWEVEP
jgi:hypothetical protein